MFSALKLIKRFTVLCVLGFSVSKAVANTSALSAPKFNLDAIADAAFYRGDGFSVFPANGAGFASGGQITSPVLGTPWTGDFDGDGLSDVAIYEGNTWHYRTSGSSPVFIGNVAFESVALGEVGDIPVLGDFDGDRDVDALDIRGLITAIVRRQSIDMSFDFNNDGLVNARDIRSMRPLCTRARCAIR